MNQTNHVFILKTNPSLNFFIEKILDFQIGRIKNYFSEKIHIWDPDNLLDSTKKFNSIKSSNFVELKQFVKSNQNKINDFTFYLNQNQIKINGKSSKIFPNQIIFIFPK